MSLNEANKIIDLYSGAILNRAKSDQNPIRFSALQDYDFCDVDNALKIQLAFIVFKMRNKTTRSELNNLASENNATLLTASSTFAPDNIVQMLNKLDNRDQDYTIKRIKILQASRENEAFLKLHECEMHSSFLDYCLSLQVNDTTYWESVFSRIGITWDERDKTDQIILAIKNKQLYFDSVPAKAIGEEIENTDASSEPKQSFLHRNSDAIIAVIIILIASIGLAYSPIRIAVFGLLILMGLVKFYFWVKEPKFEHRIGFVLNIMYIIIYTVGIINGDYGLYILILTIIFWIIDLIKKIVTNQKSS